VPVTAWLAGMGAAALVIAAGASAPPRRWPGRRADGGPPGSVDGWRASFDTVLDRALPQRRLRRRDAQLPDALDRLASALRGGRAIGPAIAELAVTSPEPLAGELRPVALALDRGAPVAVALRSWAAAAGASADVHLVVAALALGAQAGGEVARAVDRVAATLRERREVHAEVRALATQARASAAVLAIAPLAFAGLVSTIEPAAVAFLVTSPLGLVCLLAGLALEAAGAVWMGRITRSAW
jgi:tight adherence protein B